MTLATDYSRGPKIIFFAAIRGDDGIVSASKFQALIWMALVQILVTPMSEEVKAMFAFAQTLSEFIVTVNDFPAKANPVIENEKPCDDRIAFVVPEQLGITDNKTVEIVAYVKGVQSVNKLPLNVLGLSAQRES